VAQLVDQYRDEHDDGEGEHHPQRLEADAEQEGDDHEERLDPHGDAEDPEMRPCHGGSVGAAAGGHVIEGQSAGR
jgi:hypothetical protein